jgi:carbon monoxide dehydrogenase subunit G
VTELVRDTLTVDRSTPDEIWSVVLDAGALARVLPGCESLTDQGAGRFAGVLATRLGSLTLRADVTASLLEAERPRHLRLSIQGRPRSVVGSFSADVPFDLQADGDATRVSYAVDLGVTGRLASFGLPLLREVFRRQVAALVANLGQELARRRSSVGVVGEGGR